jgi:hypothetical protein
MTGDDLTRPERYCERNQARPLADRIKADPCRFCVHGLKAWGRHCCSHDPAKHFPACLSQPNGFALDPDRMTPP